MAARLLMTADEVTADPDRWQDLRRYGSDGTWGITATDITVITKLCPETWGVPFSLYTEKTTGQSLTGDSDELDLRTALEPYVIRKLARDRPDLHLSPGGLYASAAHPWLMATFDHFADGDPVEIKTVHPSSPLKDMFGAPGTAEIPSVYRAQTYIQMYVRESDRALVPVLDVSRAGRPVVYEVTRTPAVEADIAYLIQEGAAFRARLAAADPPEPDWTPASTWALKTLHPVEPDTVYELGPQLSRRYSLARQRVKAAERRAGQVLNLILDRSGGAKRVVTTDPDTGRPVTVLSRSEFPRTDIDLDMLREQFPEAAKACEKTTPVSAVHPGQKWAKHDWSRK